VCYKRGKQGREGIIHLLTVTGLESEAKKSCSRDLLNPKATPKIVLQSHYSIVLHQILIHAPKITRWHFLFEQHCQFEVE
jgi:hypothetical protein